MLGFGQGVRPDIDHVIVIGIDGMSPDGIQKAATPTLDSILKVAAYTFTCQAVLPTSSSPNWASMIMGAGPDKHDFALDFALDGVGSNVCWFTVPSVCDNG